MAQLPIYIPSDIDFRNDFIHLSIHPSDDIRLVKEKIKVDLSIKEINIRYFPKLSDTIEFQLSLKKILAKELHRYAKYYLTNRVSQHATRFGIKNINNIRIKNIKTCWGSCSAKRNLNFNLWIMLLPTLYIDSILLHELAHLTEMNHGPRFHSLLSKYLNQNDKKLNKEFRNYMRNVWPFRIQSHILL